MRVLLVRLPVILLTLALAWPASAPAQPPSAPGPPSIRREVRVGVPGVPAALDPAAALEGTIPLIARQVFDTLVAYRDGTTDVEPALATRWSVSRDGLTWSFTLRDGVRFHDGTPLTAAEVAGSFTRQFRPEGAGTAVVWPALFRGTPGVVRDVRAADTRTVQILLVQPYAPLVTVLAHPGLGVVKIVTGSDGTARLIGTGAYRVVDASSGRLALEAVPGYWGSPPKSERLVFLEVDDDDQAEAELDARTLDVWFPPGPPRRTEGALSLPGLRVGYLAFETEKVPFSRRKVRQALAAALDPVVIGVALERAAVPLQSFLPPGMWDRREGSPVLGGSRRAGDPPAGRPRPGAPRGAGDGGRPPPVPVPAVDERSGGQGATRPELLLLPEPPARRPADPRQPAHVSLRAAAALPARSGPARSGAAVAADLRAPQLGARAGRRAWAAPAADGLPPLRHRHDRSSPGQRALKHSEGASPPFRSLPLWSRLRRRSRRSKPALAGQGDRVPVCRRSPTPSSRWSSGCSPSMRAPRARSTAGG